MGIFSDKCDALIDSETGKALTGPPLAEARKDRKWPRCGARVSKAARFCNECGQGAPGGWWKCPACGKWVGNRSDFCAHCSTPLNPGTRMDLAGGVWQKGLDVLAQRFEAGEVKRLLVNGLQIQSGTAAILLDAGKVVEVLGSGRHEPDSLARKVNWFGNPPPRTVILIDDGDVALPLRIEGLRSSEQLELEFYGEIILHFNAKRADAFMANLFKTSERMTYEDLSGRLAGEIRHAVDALCTVSTVEDLVRDPERRLRLEDTLEKTLKAATERYGFDVLRVSQCEFTGDAYEALAEKEGDVEQTRRRVELDQRLLELLTKERMGQFKSEHELAEYAAQLAQERGVAGLQRGRELEVLKNGWCHQDQLEELRQKITLEKESNEHRRLQAVKDAEAAAAAAKIRVVEETDETLMWIKVREAKEKARLEVLEREAKTLAGKSLQDLISLVDDPHKREQLLKLHEQQVRAGISEKEILAQARLESLDEQKKMTEANAGRLERVMQQALEAMGKAAQGGTTQQIIK